MRFAICNEIFKGWELRRMCEFVRQAGYDALEVAPFVISPLVTDISTQQRRELRETAIETGLSISAIHWVLAYTEGMHINHPEPDGVSERAITWSRPSSFAPRSAAHT